MKKNLLAVFVLGFATLLLTGCVTNTSEEVVVDEVVAEEVVVELDVVEEGLVEEAMEEVEEAMTEKTE